MPRNSDLFTSLKHGGTIVLLLAVEAYLLLLYPFSLLFSPSFIAGGDTPSHLSAAAALREQLLAGESIHSWMHGAYGGFPLFLHYFPFPFLLMVLLSLIISLQMAFKLITLAPVLGLPIAAFACLRRLGHRDPIPILGAAFSLLFLQMKENSMWGGNIAGTLAGEFAFGISLCFAVYLTGRLHRDVPRGRSLVLNSFIEAVTALSNGYPLLQVGFGSLFFIFRRGSFRYVASLHLLAFGLIGFWILPLLLRLPWNTAFSHAWNFTGWKEALPPVLWPALIGIPLGWIARLWPSREPESLGTSDSGAGSEKYLWWQVCVALLGFAAAPLIGLVDIRFLPFAQVMLILLGAVGWGRTLSAVGRPKVWAVAFVASILVWGTLGDDTIRGWIRWNYSGLEAKPLWKPFSDVNRFIAGTRNDPRVVYEHAEENNGVGTLRAFELLPFFSGRSTLEGLYMQSSVSSPFVFYIQSEISQAPSCPFVQYYYSRFNPERAAQHLRLFNVDQIVAVSPATCEALDRSPSFEPEISFPPYKVYRLRDAESSYVVPLKYMPLRIPSNGWKQAQFEWFRKSSLDAPLVVASGCSSGDYLFQAPLWQGPFGSPPKFPITDAPQEIHVTAELRKNEIAVETSKPGHPLWVKVSYHPDWKIAEGKGELYPVSPAFMLLVPQTPSVVLEFDVKSGIYLWGKALSILSLLLTLCLAGWRVAQAGGPKSSPLSFRPGDHAAGAGGTVPRFTNDGERLFAPGSGSSRLGCLYPVVCLILLGVIAAAVMTRDDRDPALLYDRARQTYDRALKAGAGQTASPAEADERRKKLLNKAHSLFIECLERFPESSIADHAAHHIALILMSEEKWKSARDHLKAFLDANPDTRILPEALYQIGIAEEHLGNPKSSAAYYGRIVESFPDTSGSRLAAGRLVEITPKAEVYKAATEYFRQEDYPRALTLFEALSAASPSEVQMDGRYYAALCRFYLNRWDQASSTLLSWLNANRNHPLAAKARIIVAQCHIFTGRHEEARQYLDKALETDPTLAGSQPFSALRGYLEDFRKESPE